MAQIKKHDLQSQSQCSQFHFPEKAIQLLLSVYVFCFLFSYSSLLPFSIHSLNHCLSTSSMKIFSCPTDRNYIFLLCNGTLVILITNSGLITKSPLVTDFKDDDDHVEKNIGDTQRAVLQLSETKAVVMEEEVVNGIEEEQGKGNGTLVAVGNGENGLFTIENEEDEVEFLVYEEEEELEGSGLWSREELNKKCDDFIKKMKEGIKMEGQQQLIII